MKLNTIPFKKEAIKEYLDSCIKHWRKKKKEAEEESEDFLVAMCYIDAFQSVRMSLFSELLEKEIN